MPSAIPSLKDQIFLVGAAHTTTNSASGVISPIETVINWALLDFE